VRAILLTFMAYRRMAESAMPSAFRAQPAARGMIRAVMTLKTFIAVHSRMMATVTALYPRSVREGELAPVAQVDLRPRRLRAAEVVWAVSSSSQPVGTRVKARAMAMNAAT